MKPTKLTVPYYCKDLVEFQKLNNLKLSFEWINAVNNELLLPNSKDAQLIWVDIENKQPFALDLYARIENAISTDNEFEKSSQQASKIFFELQPKLLNEYLFKIHAEEFSQYKKQILDGDVRVIAKLINETQILSFSSFNHQSLWLFDGSHRILFENIQTQINSNVAQISNDVTDGVMIKLQYKRMIKPLIDKLTGEHNFLNEATKELAAQPKNNRLKDLTHLIVKQFGLIDTSETALHTLYSSIQPITHKGKEFTFMRGHYIEFKYNDKIFSTSSFEELIKNSLLSSTKENIPQ